MSCYLRHMESMFDSLDLKFDEPNRVKVDRAIRDVLGLADASCPEVWAAIKAMPDAGRAELAARVVGRL